MNSLDILREGLPEDIVRTVGQMRARMPFLKTGFRPARRCCRDDYGVFDSIYQEYQAFMSMLEAHGDKATLQACYRYFDGIRSDLRRLFPDTDFSNCLRAEELSEPTSRQLMVFVTGQCNLHCPYCFSNDLDRKAISPDDLRRIFQWASDNGCHMVTPCGGEPLIYPHLGLFLDLVAAFGMRTYFASNCTLPLSCYSDGQLECIDLMTFHMTESLWQYPAYLRTFCENIAIARQHQIDIIARGNITAPDMDLRPWLDLVDRYDIKKMNIALTIPSGSHDNRYVDTALFSDFVPVIRQCIDSCRERGVNLSFAKPIPPCVFDEDTAAWLLRYDNFMPMCNVHEDRGTRNVCLSPDMCFTPCLGVPRPQIPFSEQLTWDDLQRTLGAEIEQALQRPLFEQCERCFLYDRHLCQGACLSYKYLDAL